MHLFLSREKYRSLLLLALIFISHNVCLMLNWTETYVAFFMFLINLSYVSKLVTEAVT